MRELRSQQFDNGKYTEQNFLYNNSLIDVPRLTKNLTYLYGKDSNMFPLSFLTEGNGRVITKKPIKLNDTQYTWDVMGNIVLTTNVVRLSNSAMTTPGKGITYFKAVFDSNIIPKDYGMITPDGDNIVHVTSEPERLSEHEYEYEMQIVTTSYDTYISLDNFYNGSVWGMSTPIVPLTLSTGNRSHRTTPGKLTNQMSLHRRTLNITGNIVNKVTTIEFDTEGGGKTSLWMPEELRQWDYERRILDEEDKWYSVYNRDSKGNITTIDKETGKPIPTGAGVKEFIKAAGNHQYYTTMTLDLLENTLNRISINRTDDGPMNVVLYGGAGAKRQFQRAIKDVAVNSQYYQALGLAEIKELGLGLEFGKYFTSYRTIDDKIITFVEAGIFNKGSRAQQDIKAGRTIEGLPVHSYNMVFLDHSIDATSGEPNIVQVKEEGREMLTGIYRGMTPLPPEWGNVPNGQLLSTTRDEASYELMYSDGIAIKNANTSLWFEPEYTK